MTQPSLMLHRGVPGNDNSTPRAKNPQRARAERATCVAVVSANLTLADNALFTVGLISAPGCFSPKGVL